ncbi:hypothetical protein SteCoe_5227 [Stentor coeruleus]|uniref:PPM-type phosphatase domain-containing protein n=1 Tax=Stentor coeruleus TaxID=5963 RepID=A0A1R2CT32_9CILI|nr:hypothetical protein SteCoe_5227 [Stentor coeruleus]
MNIKNVEKGEKAQSKQNSNTKNHPISYIQVNSQVQKQKLLAEKIYAVGYSSPKRSNFKGPVNAKTIILGHFLKRTNKSSKAPKTTDNSLLPTQHSSTPKSIASKRHRGLSLGTHPIKMMSGELSHVRKSSVNPMPNVVFKYASATQTGFIPDFPQKENQDAFLEVYDREMSIFGVFDGHGVLGHKVSNYIKSRLPVLLSKSIRDVRSSLRNAISIIKEELPTLIDTSFSGSTLNLVIIKGKKLFCANIGDSRAIIGNQVNDIDSKTSSGKNWVSVSLSRDHKPDLEEEAARIARCGGRVFSYTDEEGNPLGPARVWLKDQNTPGLAMSRSLGDSVAASVGVSSEPEILEYDLTGQDKFLVIGSDGVFEFLSNEEIVKLVVPHWRSGNPNAACQTLVSSAEYQWRNVIFI